MKIALIQLNSAADMVANIATIAAFVEQAAKAGAQLVALPENAFLMDEPGGKRALYTQEEHPAVTAAALMAKTHGCWLLAGSISVSGGHEGKMYNRSLLFNPHGQIAGQYDKIHLFDVELGDGQVYKESARFIPGDRVVAVKLSGIERSASNSTAILGMSICYDLRFPQLARALAKAGAEIIAVPSAFTVPTGQAHWHVLLRARAIENGCFIIAPAQCGTHPGGRKTYGHSLIVDPWGKVLADGAEQEGIVIAELDLSEVQSTRARLPSLQHDREFEKEASVRDNK